MLATRTPRQPPKIMSRLNGLSQYSEVEGTGAISSPETKAWGRYVRNPQSYPRYDSVIEHQYEKPVSITSRWGFWRGPGRSHAKHIRHTSCIKGVFVPDIFPRTDVRQGIALVALIAYAYVAGFHFQGSVAVVRGR